MHRSIVTLLITLISISSFGQFYSLVRGWTDGEETFGLEYFSDSLIVFSGGGFHEGSRFAIKVNDDYSLEALGEYGWSIEVFCYNNERALLFRDSNNSLKRWLREMKPWENLSSIHFLNRAAHQLSGIYIREDTGETVTFFPDKLEVKGLSSSVSYSIGLDEIEFPTDVIYFSKEEGYGYEKTSTGLDIYKAEGDGYSWYSTERLVSMSKIGWLSPESSKDLPGKYAFASVEILTKDLLNYYSREEWSIIRNEIFARHGYKFKSDKMRQHFGGEEWYSGKYEDVTEQLTPLEKLNIEIIQFFEKNK